MTDCLPENQSPRHLPVMPCEVMDCLDLARGQTVLDGTVGLGGHARLMAEAIGGNGRLIGLDRDPGALALAKKNLSDVPAAVLLFRSNYADMRTILGENGISGVDRILLDIGVSSLQLDTPERGFSFMRPGPLDMRMNPEDPQSAADLIATLSEVELADLFYHFGEERFSRRIAKRVVATRGSETIHTTERLAEIVAGAVPRRGRIHPATRVFQALRIAVNDELGELTRGLDAAIGLLRPGGRLAVIAFHSLEDRIVKQTMRRWADEGTVRLIRRKAYKASREEIEVNPRARSARLRACEVL